MTPIIRTCVRLVVRRGVHQVFLKKMHKDGFGRNASPNTTRSAHVRIMGVHWVVPPIPFSVTPIIRTCALLVVRRGVHQVFLKKMHKDGFGRNASPNTTRSAHVRIMGVTLGGNYPYHSV